jgi:hypothetical protein
MSEILDRVNRQIHTMEIILHNNPIYYKEELKEQHELFIEIKKDLESSERSETKQASVA